MATIYGYARCSTDESRQDVDRQVRDLLALGVPDEEHIYKEYASGSDPNRKELHRLLDVVQEGDTIVATEVSRLTRSTQQLCGILRTVQDKHLCLRIGSFTVDCRSEELDPMTKGMLLMWGVFSEMERDMIRERVVSGMNNARAKGKRIGRPELKRSDIPRDFWRVLKLHQEGSITVADMARMLNVSRTTVYAWMAVAQEKDV